MMSVRVADYCCNGRLSAVKESVSLPISLSDEDFESLRHLLKIVTDNHLYELSVALRDDLNVTIKTAPPHAPLAAPHSAPVSSSQHHAAASSSGHATSTVPQARPGMPVVAPMVGIYYHSPTPEDPPFVKVGDIIRIGQTIGLIEAMKVFSEVPSEAAGRVIEMAAENGTLVQLGQPLFYLELA